jgi:Flp pilus assembly protein TadD
LRVTGNFGNDRTHRMDFIVATSDAEPLQPGVLFARRYRLIDRIRQGMGGEVWRADDLLLQARVALQVVQELSPHERSTILEHVQVAAQITHPAVCRVYDIGEAEDGLAYYSMELVNGESLGTILRRAGRLPSEKVIAIGQQLLSGLAAAHTRGVVHGELTLSNVLLDPAGSVRITNLGFGGAGQASATDDLHAAGLILYELLVGAPPSSSGARLSKVPKPSTLVPDVNPQLERVILQALSPDPRDRPASAAMMAAGLTMTWVVSSRDSTAAWLGGAALAAAIGILAALSSWLFQSAPPLTEQDTIVLTEFVNTTGDAVFEGTLKVALAVALEQSPFLRVFPEDQVRETLRLMQRDPDEPLTPALARNVAQRERLKALVAGSIGTVGSGYVLTLEAIDASSGDVMAREQADVRAKEDVLTELGAATARLRKTLGESLTSIQKFDTPLAEATTTSLEALHAYSLALDEGRFQFRAEAIPHLQRAIELDPNFAMAHALLSGVYQNIGRFADAPGFARRAFELRDRVSERERFFILWRYYRDAAQSWDKLLELGVSWTKTYPREAFAFNSLGLASASFGEHEQAVAAFREAIRLDPRFVPPHGNLAGSLIALDRFADAKALLADANSAAIGFITVRRMTYLLAFLENDASSMARELKLVRSSSDAAWGDIWEAWTSSFAGRFHAAHEHYRRGVQTAQEHGFIELAAQSYVQDAERHALVGECAEAQQEVRAGLELGRDNFTLERAGRTLALCGAGVDASTVGAELTKRFPAATLTMRIHLPVIQAADALQRKDGARALELLEPITPYDFAPAAEFWPAYLRGQAYLQVKDGRLAAAQFDAILRHRGVASASPLYPLSRLGLARAAALTGDTSAARSSYEAFFTMWKDADPDLQPLKDAHAEYGRLQ